MQEIAELEGQLDRIYTRVAEGARAQSLDDLLCRAADIRQLIRQKRTRLALLSRFPEARGAQARPGGKFDLDRALRKIVDASLRNRRRAFSRASQKAIGLGGLSDPIEFEDEDETGGLEYESPLENWP